MLLIFPPVAKPGEPPAGIAKLAGYLKAHDLPCTLLDANIEGLLFLLEQDRTPADTWSIRAERNLQRNLSAIHTPGLYSNYDTYQRVVRDINRVVERSSSSPGIHVSLTNYQDTGLSALNSDDLLRAATHFQDNLYFPYFSRRLDALFADQSIEVVGLSLNYLSQATTTFAMLGFLKRHHPKKEVMLGGGLVTSWLSSPDFINPFTELVDHWITGPGEAPLLKLLGRTLEHKATPDYSDLPLTDYLAPGTIIPYAASSGCYWNKCSFCPESAEKNPYHRLNDNDVSSDLASLCQKHTPALIHMVDNAIAPSLLRKMADKPPAAPWYGFARVDAGLADPDFCRRLSASGCVMLKLGIESGSQEILDAMNKGITTELMSLVLRNLEQAGIATYVYLLFGTPYESVEEARKTLEFTVEHQSAITFLNLAIFNMPVHGDDTKSVTTRAFDRSDLSLYHDFIHPRGWDRRSIRLFLDREFKRQPAIAAILRRDPPLFTSNHAPFFTRGYAHRPSTTA